jgi:hypothetical protein
VNLRANVTQGNQIEIGPDGSKLLVAPIISLNDPLPGLGEELAGGKPPTPPANDSAQYKVIVRGEGSAAGAGARRRLLLAAPSIGAYALRRTSTSDATVLPVPVPRPEGVAKLIG